MKVFVIIVVLVGAAFGIPSIRNRIAGPLDPVLSKLGPIGQAIQTPAKRFSAKNEADVIVRKVVDERDHNRPIPSPRQFQPWIRQNMRGLERKGMDPWGNPYYLERADKQVIVGSMAQDRIQGTDDDIRSILVLP